VQRNKNRVLRLVTYPPNLSFEQDFRVAAEVFLEAALQPRDDAGRRGLFG